MLDSAYEPLTVDTIAARLGEISAITERLGTDTNAWIAAEAGDGNLNLVFILKSPKSSVTVKQALPYVHFVGDSWPLPLKRAFFDYHGLTRQASHAPNMVPEIYHFDETQAMIVIEFLSHHIILRQSLIAGNRHPGLGTAMGNFCARTLFRGSDWAMDTADRKADMAPFAGNAESMLHCDLHTGSIMVTADETKVIDPEFVTYGPIGFDVGMLLSNFFMAFFSQLGHAKGGVRADCQDWILQVADEIWSVFCTEFSTFQFLGSEPPASSRSASAKF